MIPIENPIEINRANEQIRYGAILQIIGTIVLISAVVSLIVLTTPSFGFVATLSTKAYITSVIGLNIVMLAAPIIIALGMHYEDEARIRLLRLRY